jgi:hypothetical protein
MHDVWVVAISIAGALLSGLLVAWATLRASRYARLDQRRRDLEIAMGEFFAATTKAVALLSGMPRLNERHPVVAWSKVSAKVKDTIAPGWAWVDTQRRLRKLMGNQPFLPAERVVEAAARLKVLDPGPELATAVDACLDYLTQIGPNRTQSALDRWPSIHKQLTDAMAIERTRFDRVGLRP